MGYKEKIRHGISILVLVVLSVITVFPIYFLIVNSFKGQKEIVSSPIALPKSWNLEYLKNAAQQIDLGRSLLQTVLITVFAVVLIVLVSSFAAWAIARTDSKIANFIFLAYTAAMLIPFQSVSRTPLSDRTLSKNTDAELFSHIKNYLLSHLADHLTIEQICHDNLISRSRLQKLFRDSEGTGVIEYYSALKISEAKSMIRSGQMNFTQISEYLGYSSIHYFSRQFKRSTGMTPSEYVSSIRALADEGHKKA